jgi:NAD+ synthase (glutamine-hydrolysing)
MKYYICQLDPIVGDLEGNKRKIVSFINDAKKKSASLIVFPELAVCGYPPEDLLDYPHFVESCLTVIHEISQECNDITAIVGGLDVNETKFGRKLYNTAFVLNKGEVVAKVHKTLLPTYDVFTESRYFEPNSDFNLVKVEGVKVALTICEDIWDIHNSFHYKKSPVSELAELNPDIHINICASPYHTSKFGIRNKVIKSACERLNCATIYVNQASAHTGILFDGDSGVYNKLGEKVTDLALFKEDTALFDDKLDLPSLVLENYDHKIDVLESALVFGIESYFRKMGFKQDALLGSSGGIDSAVVQALASKALGGKNILAALMPSEFSSEGSIKHAIELSNNLGNPYEKFPIKELFHDFLSVLQPIFKDTAFNVAEENIQARSRGVILMAISNKTGKFLLNTSNKSEMAVGYTTLYGDMCGGLCPIGDVYKTTLYQLANHINKKSEVIPLSIINKAPSAELRPDQKDSDSLPEYEVLDKILAAYIEERLDSETIVNQGYDNDVVQKIIKLVNRNDYKRWQAAPVLRTTIKDFSYGRRMPLVAKYKL